MGKLKHKRALLALALVILIFVSALTVSSIFTKNDQSILFGVEFAYAYDDAIGMPSLLNDLKAMVDEVKDYTNLFVIGTPEISKNQTALEEACNYIYNAGLKFIILFTDSTQYDFDNGPAPFNWIADARQKYGDQFIGIYRFDEPGGNQLDNGRSKMTFNAENYAAATANYTTAYHTHVGLWKNKTNATQNGLQFITADYGLYWFDYQGGFDVILAEFGANQTQELTIGLCRGAAQAQSKDWGIIITWTYTHDPYIQSAEQIYNDLILSYEAGAKYLVIFNYPKTGQYGLLTQEHLDAMRRFWDYANSNPQRFGINKGTVAYVLPQYYGFGFRSPQDNIWGLWNADELSSKIWTDTQKLVTQYRSKIDIVYYDPNNINEIKTKYNQLYFWNQTIQ